MRFKFGLLIGFSLGYVLGARAGTQRYEQIRTQYTKLKESRQAQQLSGEVDRITDEVKSTIDSKTQEGVDSVTNSTQDKI